MNASFLRFSRRRFLQAGTVGVIGLPHSAFTAEAPGLVRSEFVFETAPFPACHASTIAETGGRLVAAWFGGTREKNRDVGIWLAHLDGNAWTPPVEVANGIQTDGSRLPCWNPVLFQPRDGPLLLLYKVGPSPDRWWGMMRTSGDHGRTWSDARRLPDGILGPIKNKPVELDDGTILCGSSTEPDGWKVHFERTKDQGRTWEKTPALNDGKTVAAIQPALCRDGNSIMAFCRSEQKKIFATTSSDGGKTWSALEPTALPNPNSGIDATRLKDGRCLIIYNHTPRDRTPLNVALTRDGKSFEAVLVLENSPGEYSYPAVIQTADGFVHVTYTWQRKRIRHAVLDPAKFQGRPMSGGAWPQ
jgi:predicted neuraminidase